jgi:hypothetical protein
MPREYNFMDNNPDNYPQKPIGGLTADQEAQRHRAECWALYANGFGISPRDFDYMFFLRSSDAQFEDQQAQLREQFGRQEDHRRHILGHEEEQRLRNMSR